MKSLGIILTVTALGAGGWIGYNKYVAESPSDTFVLKKLDRGDITQTVSATGTIEPVTKVIVGSQVSGNILKWYADFNAKVPAGFVLAELDPDRFKTAFNQAKAEVLTAKAREEEARVRHKDAQRERKRIQELMDKSNASENEFLIAQAAEDAALAAWHAAQAGVEAAEASRNSAQVDLDRTIIRSPIDGVVISRNIDVGQTVAASLQAPELFLIANDLTRMQVNANVAESDIGLIAEGRPATFRVDAYPNRTFTGKISQIRYNATILDGVVTYVTLIEVHNPDYALRPGMTANVTFEVAKVANVVRIPNAALRFNPNPPDSATASRGNRGGARVPTVYVVEKKKPKSMQVQIGLSDGAYTELVAGGLQEGSAVITERAWQGRDSARANPMQSMRPPRG
ncbi:MAG TPA: efflux RND transporter periplasmic adaptor subunit [Phycisphaerae bacterium]|nr:efflux RND transporter periplasmic adaptor subunit [Phycisphaerae bacterium]